MCHPDILFRMKKSELHTCITVKTVKNDTQSILIELRDVLLQMWLTYFYAYVTIENVKTMRPSAKRSLVAFTQ